MTDTTALAQQLKSDGNTIDGENVEEHEIWWETGVGTEIDVLGFGVFEVVESAVGKEGNVYAGNGCNVWQNYIILKQGDDYYRLNGEYDSWDPQGWDGKVEEVEQREKVITVWETK